MATLQIDELNLAAVIVEQDTESNLAIEDTEVVTVIAYAEVESVVETPDLDNAVVTDTEVVAVITEGIAGPPGPPGLAEDDVVYAKRMDMVSDSLIYKGEAAVGSSDTDAVWRIRRVALITVGDLVDTAETWADGTANFAYQWADRASLTYL